MGSPAASFLLEDEQHSPVTISPLPPLLSPAPGPVTPLPAPSPAPSHVPPTPHIPTQFPPTPLPPTPQQPVYTPSVHRVPSPSPFTPVTPLVGHLLVATPRAPPANEAVPGRSPVLPDPEATNSPAAPDPSATLESRNHSDIAALILGATEPDDGAVLFDQNASDPLAAGSLGDRVGGESSEHTSARDIYVEHTDDSRTDTDSHHAPLSTIVEESEDSLHHTGQHTLYQIRSAAPAGFPVEDPSTEGAVFDELDKLAQAEERSKEEDRLDEAESVNEVPALLSPTLEDGNGLLDHADGSLKRRPLDVVGDAKRIRTADVFRAPAAPRVTFLTED